jgi:hypothetical protein
VPTITIDNPPRMNLLGLILGSLVERNLERDEKLRRRFAKLAAARVDIVVEAGRMAVTLRFAEGGLVIKRGAEPGARAAVSGSLDALMGLALGGGMVRPVLSGALKPRGSLRLLLAMKRLLRAA